jgi:hypothetical protein
MLVNRKTLAMLMAISCSTAPVAVLPQSVPGDSCSNINLVGVGCATFRFVGVEREKPFIAQRVVTSTSHDTDGTITKVEWTEFTARDSEGRIRFEQKTAFKAPDWRENGVMTNHDIEKIVLPAVSLGSLVTIFDCFKRKSIVMQPELAVAHVIQTCDSLRPEQWGNDPYSYLITRPLNLKTPPNVLVEDLGYREIDGIGARGMRSTFLGTEKDGEWSGRPIGVVERWMSDELAATVLYIHSDLKTQDETVSRFANIIKGPPGAALFEIPPGYKVIISQDTVESGVKEKPL